MILNFCDPLILIMALVLMTVIALIPKSKDDGPDLSLTSND